MKIDLQGDEKVYVIVENNRWFYYMSQFFQHTRSYASKIDSVHEQIHFTITYRAAVFVFLHKTNNDLKVITSSLFFPNFIIDQKDKNTSLDSSSLTHFYQRWENGPESFSPPIISITEDNHDVSFFGKNLKFDSAEKVLLYKSKIDEVDWNDCMEKIFKLLDEFIVSFLVGASMDYLGLKESELGLLFDMANSDGKNEW